MTNQGSVKDLEEVIDRLIHEQTRSREFIESLERSIGRFRDLEGLTISGALDTVLERYTVAQAAVLALREQLKEVRKLATSEGSKKIQEAIDKLLK